MCDRIWATVRRQQCVLMQRTKAQYSTRQTTAETYVLNDKCDTRLVKQVPHDNTYNLKMGLHGPWLAKSNLDSSCRGFRVLEGEEVSRLHFNHTRTR